MTLAGLNTLRSVHEHAHTLHAHCSRCERWVQLDLEALIAAGQGDRRLPWQVRCKVCGERGDLQLRPPMPDWTGVAGTWGGAR